MELKKESIPIIQKIYQWRFEFTGIVLSCWGLYLRFLHRLGTEVTGDEHYSFTCIRGEGTLKPLLWEVQRNGEQICFPGYYYTTWPFVKVFGDDRWGMNIPHILMTMLGFYFFYLLCRRYIKHIIPFTVALLCFDYQSNLIFHAFEFRPYTVLTTLALGLLFFFERSMEGAYQNLGKKFWLFLFIVFSVWYHAYGILMVGVIAAYFLAREKNSCQTQRWRDFLKFIVLCLGVSMPIFLFYASGTVWEKDLDYNPFLYIVNPVVDPVQFMRSVIGNLVGSHPFSKALFLGGILGLFISPSSRKRDYIGFFLFLIIIPIIFILLADIKRNYWFLQRQFVWTMPFFALLVGWMWDGIFDKLKKSNNGG